MGIPAPFHNIFDQWERQGRTVSSWSWTTGLHRHIRARVDIAGTRYFAKLALAKQHDLDEKDLLEGMRREVWWSQVIHALREHTSKFPFTTPGVIETNVDHRPFREDVAWIIMEHVDGQPIVEWEPERSNRCMDNEEVARFDRLFDVVINSLMTLERIHPDTLRGFDLPPLPSPPHGMRRWQKRGMLNMDTAVLGNGAFEIKNFWRTPDGQLVIIDNEFAGWYPKYDHLSYLYHRLYCNTMRPDLAKRLLSQYMHRAMEAGEFDALPESLLGFWQQFIRILKPHLLSGWWNDTKRRKLPPWHIKQQLRYRLLWAIARKRYGTLAF